MTLKDAMNVPALVVWLVFGVFVLLSIVLLSGHGAELIAGYNTADKAEREKYDQKKLCRVTGAGMSVISLLLFVMAGWSDVLPFSFVWIFLAIVIIDCVALVILLNTVCKK